MEFPMKRVILEFLECPPLAACVDAAATPEAQLRQAADAGSP
jgi:hypothetical protein